MIALSFPAQPEYRELAIEAIEGACTLVGRFAEATAATQARFRRRVLASFGTAFARFARGASERRRIRELRLQIEYGEDWIRVEVGPQRNAEAGTVGARRLSLTRRRRSTMAARTSAAR